MTGDNVRISNVKGNVIGGSIKGSGNIVGNNVRISVKQLSNLPDDYAEALRQFSKEINHQFKINNVPAEHTKVVQNSINDLVGEIKDVDEKKLSKSKKIIIKGRVSTIVENVLNALPQAAEIASAFTPLAPFSRLIGQGIEQVVKGIRE